MRSATVIDMASRRILTSQRRQESQAEHHGIFRTARQAGAYVYAMSAKMPSLEDSDVNGWIAARDIITATYHHFDDLAQTDSVTLAIARTSRLMPHYIGREITGHIDGRTQRIEFSISSRVIQIGFSDDASSTDYIFGRFEESYIPIDMQVQGKGR